MSNNESLTDERHPPSGTSAPASGPQIEISSDEDWKNRVKAEDAALDQQFRTQPGGEKAGGVTQPATPESSQATDTATVESTARGHRGERQPAREMPQPTFADLVGLLSAQAMMFLGMIPNPASQPAEIQLPTARYFIDMISILEEKTAGQLTKAESQILDDTLHSLRMTYMQRSQETG
jgi:hypothetical protein